MKLRSLGLLLLLGACAEDAELGEVFTDASYSPATGYDGGGGFGDSGSPNIGWDAGQNPDQGGDSGTTPGTGNPIPSGGLPCEVQAILKDKCQTCHSDPTVGAPMPLVTREHLLASNTSGAKYVDRVKARINDTANPMPPKSRPPLTAAEKQTLEAYLNAGAPASTSATCGGTQQPDGGTSNPDDEYQPPDSECEVIMELRAHGGQTPNDTTPFTIPSNGDTDNYEIFYFTPTWTKKMHVIRVDPIIDNGAVLHHWLLYMQDGNGSGNGTHHSDSGLQSPDSQLLSGWAPGNKSLPLGRDIGMQVIQGPNARFGIELHYNTASNPANRKDRSGARLCLTSKLRPKEATTHWLGTQGIQYTPPFVLLGRVNGPTYETDGKCTVQKESHIIAYSPHMHTRGKFMKSIITKKGGSKVTLNDGVFDFDDQQIFPVKTTDGAREIVVQPGDSIMTTCGYDATKGSFTFGPGTSDEMCYNFVVAWPAGSLAGRSTGIVGGKNTCID